ncbi:MAG: YkgJ family cysteine cluster protein, partial [Candidatus Thorarchaeota archaeon]
MHPQLERIHDEVCTRCGECCSNITHVNLTPFETPLIASRLNAYGGKSAVRRHLQQRKVEFNFYTRNVLIAPSGGCVFLSRKRCAIFGDRPLECRLYPSSVEGFLDDIFGLLPQRPVIMLSGTPGECHERAYQIHQLASDTPIEVQTLSSIFVAFHVGRRRVLDYAHLFCRPSEEVGTLRHFDGYNRPEGYGIRETIHLIYRELVGGDP